MSKHQSIDELSRQVAVMRNCTCFQLRKASRVVTQAFEEQLQHTGLRATQITVLAAIVLKHGSTVSTVAEELAMDRTTLARNIKPLEKKGLVAVFPGRDRRERVLEVTDLGRESLAAIFPLWQKAQAAIVDGLGQDRWQSLLDHLSDTIAQVQRS